MPGLVFLGLGTILKQIKSSKTRFILSTNKNQIQLYHDCIAVDFWNWEIYTYLCRFNWINHSTSSICKIFIPTGACILPWYQEQIPDFGPRGSDFWVEFYFFYLLVCYNLPELCQKMSTARPTGRGHGRDFGEGEAPRLRNVKNHEKQTAELEMDTSDEIFRWVGFFA